MLQHLRLRSRSLHAAAVVRPHRHSQPVVTRATRIDGSKIPNAAKTHAVASDGAFLRPPA